jgi:glutaredoxin
MQQQAEGIVQVPDFVLDGRPVLSVSDFEGKGRRALKICDTCKSTLAAATKG